MRAQIDLRTPGVRERVMDRSWARQHVRVRLPPWQLLVDAGNTHVGSASRPVIPPAPRGGDHPMRALACASRCAPLEGGCPDGANGSYHILTRESEQAFSTFYRISWWITGPQMAQAAHTVMSYYFMTLGQHHIVSLVTK